MKLMLLPGGDIETNPGPAPEEGEHKQHEGYIRSIFGYTTAQAGLTLNDVRRVLRHYETENIDRIRTPILSKLADLLPRPETRSERTTNMLNTPPAEIEEDIALMYKGNNMFSFAQEPTNTL